MATRKTLEDTHDGLSPDQARDDYLAWSLEEIRSVLSKPIKSIDQFREALHRVEIVLDRIPPQF